MTMKVSSYAAKSATTALEAFNFERREPRADDVVIKILYCGVCHSDIHQARNEWGGSLYPMVPGHEIIGKVTKLGANVTNFKIDDLVGVGCLVDSCKKCASCHEGLEQYCENGFTATYNSKDKNGELTQGGYSTAIVVQESFVVKIPDNLDPKAAAPLLCAGITTYSPLCHWKIKPGDRLGVVGLGGLGHMAVKLASAMGAHVTMITTSPNKTSDAKKLGAHEVLISKDAASMTKHANHFDFIINTVPHSHDINPYIALLKRDGTMAMVGCLNPIDNVAMGAMILGRKTVAGSVIGGILETQEMLDFCGKHNIVADIEVINIKDINKAYDRMLKSDVKYRFVIDMVSLQD